MKQASFFLSQMTNQPLFNKIEQTKSHKKLLALLPPRYQNGVKFMYNKNDTLFFILKHNGFLMEFKYKKTDIKNILKKLIEQDGECSCIDAQNLEFRVAKITNETEPKPPQKCVYKELSKGTFANFAADAKMKALFEEIRELICKKAT